jgi:hypothetical protein
MHRETLLPFFFLHIITSAIAQYPFEKFPAVKYQEFKDWKTYDKWDSNQKIHFTIAVPFFFENQDSLTVQLTSFESKFDSSIIRLFRNKRQIQKLTEPMFFATTNTPYEPARVADITGDGRKDVKLVIPYMGNGIASLNQRVIYLFQRDNDQFDKISFLDMMEANRPERDFDSDNQFEIITMDLKPYQNHNYWTFNIYNYENGSLINKNEKYGYPIVVQYLYKKNFKVTNKIPIDKMKSFGENKPTYFSQN